MRGELDQLRVLVAVADNGSFTGAAAERNIEISAISRAMRDLEEAIGTTLFDRLPRGVKLTEAGRSYVVSARDILDRYEQASRDARLVGSGRSLHLTIGFVWSPASAGMVDLLRSCALEAPEMGIDVVEGGGNDLIARARSGRIDVAITVVDPPPLPRLKTVGLLSTMPLWLEPLAAAAPASANLENVTWATLESQRLLCRTVDDAKRFSLYVERVSGAFLTFESHAVSQEGLLGLVAAGLGWTVIAESAGRLMPANVSLLSIASPGATLQVEAVWRVENVNPALNRFLGLCRRMYGSASAHDAPLRKLDRSP